MTPCNEFKNDCNKCDYSYLCEYRMKVSDNVPVIKDGVFVSDTTKRNAIKSQFKVVK